MKKLVLATVAAASLFAAGGAASAQVYYSGPGFGVQVGPRYEERYVDRYDEPRYYRRHHHRYYGERYYRQSSNGCPPHYTVQDGVCKPYRGY